MRSRLPTYEMKAGHASRQFGQCLLIIIITKRIHPHTRVGTMADDSTVDQIVCVCLRRWSQRIQIKTKMTASETHSQALDTLLGYGRAFESSSILRAPVESPQNIAGAGVMVSHEGNLKTLFLSHSHALLSLTHLRFLGGGNSSNLNFFTFLLHNLC